MRHDADPHDAFAPPRRLAETETPAGWECRLGSQLTGPCVGKAMSKAQRIVINACCAAKVKESAFGNFVASVADQPHSRRLAIGGVDDPPSLSRKETPAPGWCHQGWGPARVPTSHRGPSRRADNNRVGSPIASPPARSTWRRPNRRRRIQGRVARVGSEGPSLGIAGHSAGASSEPLGPNAGASSEPLGPKGRRLGMHAKGRSSAVGTEICIISPMCGGRRPATPLPQSSPCARSRRIGMT